MYEESYNKVRLGGWMDGGGKSGPRQAENGGWMDDERMDGIYYGAVPQSVIARRSSGFRRKSRNPVLWMPT